MNARAAATVLMLTAWVLWSPVALASHMGMAGRPMCAGPGSSHDLSALGMRHLPAHGGGTMNETAGKPCSLGLCVAFISPDVSAETSFSVETHAQHPPQDLLMALLQIPDPVPKPLHLSA